MNRLLPFILIAWVLPAVALAAEAAAPVSAAPAAISIDCYLAEPPLPKTSFGTKLPPELEALRSRLAEEVGEVIDGPRWAPLRVEPGLAGCEFSFDQSGEVFRSLSLAALHLPPDVRRRVTDYLRRELEAHPPHTAGCWYPPAEGRRRENYRLSDDLLVGDHRRPRFHPFGNVYALWLFAARLDQWAELDRRWPEIEAAAGDFEQSGWHFDPAQGDLHANRYLAAWIGYARIARRLGQEPAAESARRQATRLAAGIVEHYRRDADAVFLPEFDNVQDFDRWRAAGAGGFFLRPSGHKGKPAKFQDLTPEVGGLLADQAAEATRKYLAFVDRSLPGWYLTGEERQFHFGENYVDYPDFALAIFEARAYIERAPAARLAGWVDMPWCAADLYFIRKLSLVLESAAGRQ